MSQVLVTGGTGYIGSHTVVELLENGYSVIIIDNLSNSNSNVLKRIKMINSNEFKFYEIDLEDKPALVDVFNTNQIDAVIHFAGFKSVSESVNDPLKYYRNNILGTLNLIEVMQSFAVKKLIFSSSATVYGLENKSPIEEDAFLGALNPYGNTKLMLEQVLRDLFESDNSWGISLLRYFNPIGAHESGLIGEDSKGMPNNIMPYITKVAVGEYDKLHIFGNDYNTKDGTGIRDYIHVVDLAKGHIKALEILRNSIGIEAYNLGTGIGYSVLELVNDFQRATGIDIPFIYSHRRPGDVDICYANPMKAYLKLGWKAEKTLEQMCKDSWRWQYMNPNGLIDETDINSNGRIMGDN